MSEPRVARRELESIRRLSAEEARDLVERRRAVLVDTRDPSYYAEAHAVGAISVPFAEIRRSPLHPRLQSVPEDQQLILYCT